MVRIVFPPLLLQKYDRLFERDDMDGLRVQTYKNIICINIVKIKANSLQSATQEIRWITEFGVVIPKTIYFKCHIKNTINSVSEKNLHKHHHEKTISTIGISTEESCDKMAK